MNISRLLKYSAYLLIALAALKGFYHLASLSWFFFAGEYTGDAKYYFTVGRGIVNGHVLYTDIFDTKPPGVYLLSALSMSIFNSAVLGSILNGLIVLAYPITFGLAAYVLDRRVFTVVLSALFGLLLALNSGFQAGAWQVEWFGAFFGSLYALALVLTSRSRTSKLSIGILSICMVLTIGFKEPFALVLIGTGLVLLPTKKDLLYGLLLPLIITAIVGVIGLLVFGYAGGYFSTYLPSHFGHHLVRSVPLWQRGFYANLMLKYLWEFSYAFSALIVILFSSALLQSRQFVRPVARIGLIVLALYLGLTAGNLRGYPVASHFVALIPLYTALFLLLLKRLDITARIFMGVMVFTLITLPMSDGYSQYAAALLGRAKGEAVHKETADKIDAILDACDVDRYFFVEERPYMEYMQHSPLNFFVYAGPSSIVYYHPKIIEKHLKSFSAAKIVIAAGDSYEIREQSAEKALSEMTFRYLANNFTILPWECAADLSLPDGYSVLFRKDLDAMKPFLFKMK
ncbi:MAG: hypothetical protein HOG89_04145 [Candidatus Peribacter sp.]|jgi:hypothetical protein|nr:hypothetical protein [Candidatus Peribacter sp.]MBT4393358.1 hypothetical protein [Candidatus Peribacter sp.]MBT4600803.1 hypothetical protein [Candidatus Peribacter sp.]MBT5149151.1 hypothetical protein [Candidatus Peribacter sp.]MBT5937968.1 hypothetical protein [Candidatus Peribacter sp.]